MKQIVIALFVFCSPLTWGTAQTAAEEGIAQRFSEVQRSIRRHRAKLIGRFHSERAQAELGQFDVQRGSRVFFRWADRPFVELESVRVGVQTDEAVYNSDKVRIRKEQDWGVNWYSVWLPVETLGVAILSVEVIVSLRKIMNPFLKSSISQRYVGQIPMLGLSADNPKILLVSMEAQSPFSQKKSSQPELKLSSLSLQEVLR